MCIISIMFASLKTFPFGVLIIYLCWRFRKLLTYSLFVMFVLNITTIYVLELATKYSEECTIHHILLIIVRDFTVTLSIFFYVIEKIKKYKYNFHSNIISSAKWSHSKASRRCFKNGRAGCNPTICEGGGEGYLLTKWPKCEKGRNRLTWTPADKPYYIYPSLSPDRLLDPGLINGQLLPSTSFLICQGDVSVTGRMSSSLSWVLIFYLTCEHILVW